MMTPEEKKLYMRDWEKRHRAARSKRHREYMRKNPEQRKKQKEWRERNRERVKQLAREWHEAQRAVILKAKDRPCADCDKVFHHWAMEFDHARGEKLFDISSSRCGVKKNLNKLLEEIAKCDVVCANCHRYRTYLRARLKGETDE